MPFCTSCGAEVTADKKFCPQCGSPMEPVIEPAGPAEPASLKIPIISPSTNITQPGKSKKPRNSMIIAGIFVILVIVAAAYIVGMPLLKSNQKSSDEIIPSPTSDVSYTITETELPTPDNTPATRETTILPVTTTMPVQIRDVRLEEEYESIYTLNQKFMFGQKVNFAHDLTRPPLYVKFNLTPTLITRHRIVSIGTNNEHYENTTENSPYAWFEITIFDAGSGAIIDQQGFGKDYSDITKQDFMVRQKGNYRIEMSGNEVKADVQMLIGTAS